MSKQSFGEALKKYGRFDKFTLSRTRAFLRKMGADLLLPMERDKRFHVIIWAEEAETSRLLEIPGRRRKMRHNTIEELTDEVSRWVVELGIDDVGVPTEEGADSE